MVAGNVSSGYSIGLCDCCRLSPHSHHNSRTSGPNNVFSVIDPTVQHGGSREGTMEMPPYRPPPPAAEPVTQPQATPPASLRTPPTGAAPFSIPY